MILSLQLVFRCITLPIAAPIVEACVQPSVRPKKCTLQLGNYYAVPVETKWFNVIRTVEFKKEEPQPTWIAKSACGSSNERCYQLGYDDSCNKRWWLSKSGNLTFSTTKKVWHYVHEAKTNKYILQAGDKVLYVDRDQQLEVVSTKNKKMYNSVLQLQSAKAFIKCEPAARKRIAYGSILHIAYRLINDILSYVLTSPYSWYSNISNF